MSCTQEEKSNESLERRTSSSFGRAFGVSSSNLQKNYKAASFKDSMMRTQALQAMGQEVVLTIAFQEHQSYLCQSHHPHALLISLYHFSSPYPFLFHRCPIFSWRNKIHSSKIVSKSITHIKTLMIISLAAGKDFSTWLLVIHHFKSNTK